MIRLLTYLIVMLLAGAVMTPADSEPSARPVWPPAPDQARIEYIGSIDCADLKPAGGFLKKLGRWIGGRSEDELLSLPFDLVSSSGSLFMVCQKVAALIEVDRSNGQFTLHRCDQLPLGYPVSLCDGGAGIIFVTDSETGVVFRFSEGRLEPFITENLVRPTGVTALPGQQRLYVVDTGEQSLKIFDYEGRLVRVVAVDENGEPVFNFPTFATSTVGGSVLVNDGLNYQIKEFDSNGNLLGSFGEEGDGPGTFSRPKGIAVDSDAHIYVVDNLFDNVQVFDPSGQVLLALGSAGSGAGQFWSPTGIDIESDTIFIADTFNHRIQILHYLGGEQ